jgi:hypothetical protein
MTDLNRGIMRFKGADSPGMILVSAVVVLGAIAALVAWALRSAYVI